MKEHQTLKEHQNPGTAFQFSGVKPFQQVQETTAAGRKIIIETETVVVNLTYEKSAVMQTLLHSCLGMEAQILDLKKLLATLLSIGIRKWSLHLTEQALAGASPGEG